MIGNNSNNAKKIIKKINFGNSKTTTNITKSELKIKINKIDQIKFEGIEDIVCTVLDKVNSVSDYHYFTCRQKM